MFKDCCMVYTDASKNIEGVGCAYWDSSNKISKMFKLNSIMSIYTAELIAIIEALKYLSNINHSKFIIYSDSKSSLSKISAINPKSKVNYIELFIINKIKELQQQGKSVKLAWVKSHCGITGNEMVDELAKNTVTKGVLTHYLCTSRDLESDLFKELKKEWNERYIDENINTGNHYRSIRNYITDKPWFSKIESTKDMTRTICRMRFNHCLTPSYIYLNLI
ncbi:uncharacterized protein LOC126884550 isoform X1 [Diabrotica virgifera virgifera]|uniref:ribonuclease H n=1 Tax=Diabrotica virgifera virgifera TaxID=50390 RepID=A0ABM5K8F6_DIAVI|nr:uncharacterized protein LOC126884550 isoform X1 [Diabrotica virgifera virgifera]